MDDLLIMYAIAVLLIVCGFAALLLQKTYISEHDGTQTEIDLPFFGKLKTNYPALAFVLLGCAGAFYTFDNRTQEWVISGTLELPDDPELKDLRSSGFKWNEGSFTTFPPKFTPHIEPNGKFELRIEVAGSGSVADFVKSLMYEHPDASKEIALAPEAVKDSAGRAIKLYPITVEYFGE